MGYTPTEPEAKTVQVDAERDLTVFHIHRFTVFVDPNDPQATTVNIDWTKGYMDGGTYVIAEGINSELSGTSVLLAATAAVTPENSRYDEIKGALWQLLVDSGQVPEGQIV